MRSGGLSFNKQIACLKLSRSGYFHVLFSRKKLLICKFIYLFIHSFIYLIIKLCFQCSQHSEWPGAVRFQAWEASRVAEKENEHAWAGYRTQPNWREVYTTFYAYLDWLSSLEVVKHFCHSCI